MELYLKPLLSVFNLLGTTKNRIGTSLFMLLPPIGLFAAWKFYKNGFVVEDRFPMIYSKEISCRFNPVMLHGVECGEDFSASLRVDGEYTEDFREIVLGDREWKTTFEFVDEVGYFDGF